MTNPVAYLIGFALIVYICLTAGCILSAQPDASLEDERGAAEFEQSAMAVTCLIPRPTLLGVALAFGTTLTAGYLGLSD